MTEIKPILPAESSSTEMTRFNALRHGVLSRYTVLPWEDAEEYRALVAALVAEHAPDGPTEEHLVEELAGILWRKRRLRLAEAAAHRRGLESALAPWSNTVEAALVHLGAFARWEGVADAIRATQAETVKDIADIEENEAMTRHALDQLGSGRSDAYEAALAALRDDTRQWWEDLVTGDTEVLDEDKKRYPGDTAGLRDFLEGEILPRLARRGKELSYRPLIREQALGEALDLGKLEQLGRYEVHLDRKLERMLAMLLRLKELRRTTETK
jgi:hypothetical protein